jgi:outer membrane protein OmpA-like peptidoglycan-associated protein
MRKGIKGISVATLCAVVALAGCKAGANAKGGGKGEEAGTLRTVSVIGAAVGGAAGALISRKMDEQKQQMQAALPTTVTIETIKKGEALKITFASAILFLPNSSTIGDSAKSVLRTLATSLNGHPDTGIKIIGHTDNTGRAELNRILSEKRAKSIHDYLAAQHVDVGRMTYEGRGFHDPVADNRTPEGLVKNRRVDIYLLAGNKMVQDAHNETAR